MHRTSKDIVRVQTRWQTLVEKRAKRGLQFIVEQRLFAEGDRSQIPLEYRAYTFLDEVRLIQQVDRNVNPPEEVFYVNEFEAVADGTKIESSWKAIKRGTPQVPGVLMIFFVSQNAPAHTQPVPSPD